MADTQFSLSVLFTAVDLITAPVRRITSAMEGVKHPITAVKSAANSLGRMTGIKELNKQLAESRARWQATAGAATTSAEKIARGVKAMAGSAAVGAVLNQRAAVEDALGGLASLGVKDLGVVETAATEFSENWSKFSKTAILEAAYKIKSGIGDLTDAGVGEFAKMAALTATATRGEVDAVSMAFGQGYNVFRQQFASDEAFANAFSAAMSKTVKDFQTDGGQLSEAMKNLGAAATNMKTPLAEQMVVLGNLQNVMGSGAAAGTAYKSMMNQLIPAGKKLGTSFTDANGAAMSIDQIVAKIEEAKAAAEAKGIGANFMNDLRQAFGDEAFAALSNLIGKSAQLEKQIKSTSEATKQGAAYTQAMAKLADSGLGAAMRKLINIISNVVDAIGGTLAPVVEFAAEAIGGLVAFVRSATAVVPGLGSALKVIVGAASAVAVGVGVASMAMWAWQSSIMATAKTIVTWLIPSLGKAIKGIWSFAASLLASPMAPFIIAAMGVAAAAVLIWQNWDNVVEIVEGVIAGFNLFVEMIWGKIKPAVDGFAQGVKATLAAIGQAFGWLFAPVTELMDFLKGLWGNVVAAWDSGTLWDAGAAMFTGLWDGLKAVWESIAGWLDGVMEILAKPFKMAADLIGLGGDDKEKAAPKDVAAAAERFAEGFRDGGMADYRKTVESMRPSGPPIGAAEAVRQSARAKAEGGKDRVDVDGVVKIEFGNAPAGMRVRQMSQKGDQRIGVNVGQTFAMAP